MSRASEYAANAARILQAKGDAIAQGHLTRGNIIGNTIATLGQVIPQQVQEVMKRNAEKRKTEQIHGILGKYPNDLGAAANEIMAIDRDLGTKLLEQNMQAKKFAMETAKFDDDMKQRKQSMLLKPFLTATTEDEWDQARLNARVAGVDKDIPYASMPWSPDLPKRMLLDQMSPEKRYEALYPDAPKAPDPFTLSEGQTRFRPDGTVIANVPKPPGSEEGGFTLTPGGRRYDATGKLIASAPHAPSTAQGPQPGWQWVMRNGEEIYTNRVQPGDKPKAGVSTTTEDERKMAMFYPQMKDAIAVMDELENKITQTELYQIQTLPQEKLIGMLNRGNLSENAKRYLRAFEQFTEARLRPVSGAAIVDSEYERDRRTYAKQYAETPKLNQDRRRARDNALAGLRTRAGRAFVDDATAPAPPPPPAGGSFSVKAPDGKTYTFPTQKAADDFKKAIGPRK